MKQPASDQKTSQQNIRTLDRSASAGPNGTAVMPPAYGMDLVDRGFGDVLQTKLIINRPGDEHEQEVDRIASQVMTAPADHAVGRTSPRIQRMMGQSGEQTETAPASVYQALAAPGVPLEPSVRQDMEQRFGYDFSPVRVHTGGVAEQSARDVHAHAYTVGRDIVFGPSQYAPHQTRGRQVLAHELTHVVQQGGGETGGQKAEQLQRWNLEDTLMVGAATLIGGPSAGLTTALTRSPEVLETVAGGLMGEFNEDPTFAMIGVDLGVSLVPILDQVSDARDIIAHIYYMTVREQYNRFMRWIGLVFSLIGLFPEFGSAIKGASKFIIKGVREVIEHMADLLRAVRRFLPEIGDIGRLQSYVARHWSRFVAFGTGAWNRGLERASRVLDRVRTVAGDFVRRMQDRLTRIREIGPAKIREAFGWVKNKIDEVLDAVAERLGLRGRRQVEEVRPSPDPSATAGARPAASPEPRRAAARTGGGTSYAPVPSTGRAGNRGASVRTQARREEGGPRGPRPLPTAPRPYVRPGDRALRDDFLRRFRSRQGNTWRDPGRMGHTVDRHMPGTPGSGSKFPSDWTEMDVFEAGYHVANDPRNLRQVGREPGMDYYIGRYGDVTVRVQVDPLRRAIHSVAKE